MVLYSLSANRWFLDMSARAGRLQREAARDMQTSRREEMPWVEKIPVAETLC